jgi:GH18 family chitinase
MKQFYKIFLGLLLPVFIVSCKKESMPAPKPTTVVYKAPANFRIVGYMYIEDAESEAGKSFDLSRINYLNIAFINPDATGNFGSLAQLAPMITAAHSHNVKIMLSLGGANASAFFPSLLGDANRDNFINTLVQLAVNNNVDGIDVDLEGDNIDTHYEAFITGLSAGLKAKSKLLTAAIATWEAGSFTDKALAGFDFVNVMSYDATGPWDPTHPGPHSPYSMAVSDLNYWINTRGLNKANVNLGVPFYGYGFGAGVPVNIDYNQVVKNYPGSQNTDQVTVTAGGTVYYNGIPTIEKKTTLAMQNAGGIMAWELMADTDDDNSLLTAIDRTANPGNN